MTDFAMIDRLCDIIDVALLYATFVLTAVQFLLFISSSSVLRRMKTIF
jgi:hypothetical protein